jgi:hypothetical protein
MRSIWLRITSTASARGVGVGQERQLFGQHVAGLEIGHQENVGIARDLRADALDLGGLLTDRVVEGKRPVEQGAGDLTALGHLTQRRGAVRSARVRETRGRGRPDGRPRIPGESLARLDLAARSGDAPRQTWTGRAAAHRIRE